MKMKKLMVAFLALTMLATGIIGSGSNIQAATGVTVMITKDEDLIIKPGETTHIKIPIKAVGGYIPNPVIVAQAEDGAPFTISKPVITLSNYPVTDIYTADGIYLEFDVKVKDTAGIDIYSVPFKFTYYDFLEEKNVEIILNTQLQILEEKTPSQITASNVILSNSAIGSDSDFTFTIKNEGEITAKNVYVQMNYGGVIDERYSVKKIKIGDLVPGDSQRITLPITILSSATAGRKPVVADFTYKTVDGDPVAVSYNINIDLKENENGPKLSVDDIAYAEDLKPGKDFIVTVALSNIGAATAGDVIVSVDDASISKDTILRDYLTDGIIVSNIKEGGTKTAKIPLTISKYATGGLKELKINISYTDNLGVVYSLSNIAYLDIIGEGTAGSPNIIISGVKQSPMQPIAGDKVEVSFDFENKSMVDITELKISTDTLTGNTFIPIESEPYQYIEKLKGGETRRITIPLIVSGNIQEGLNNLTVKYTYASGEGSVSIPIRDVQNDLGSNSKPKLIVSKYVTDVEELRAGSTFHFTFDLYNTNSSVAAKNITVTVTQPENIFTVTQGSNSFFINKIEAGETVQNTLELKVKSDASTKAYPIEIAIEYEYDGAEPNPTTGEVGESKVEKLNLQAVENSRPVVDYVNVYSWDGNVTVGNNATLAFEFYNMGKSPLNNVIATVEGDFMKADGNMYFIGNVMEGSSTYAEFDVIPNLEGTAKGTLKITFEDSNGEEVEFIKEFEAMVQGAGSFDPGMGDGGTGEVFNPMVPEAKKAIIPLWLFVILQVVIVALFIPITRKIIISVYKSKLRKKEQEQY